MEKERKEDKRRGWGSRLGEGYKRGIRFIRERRGLRFLSSVRVKARSKDREGVGGRTFLSGDQSDLDKAGELLEEGHEHALARLIREILQEKHSL